MKRALLALLALAGLSGFAVAQSASDLNEGTKLTLESGNIFAFKWYGLSGRTYFIQTSPDCLVWTYLDDICFGTNEVVSYGFETSANTLFLRLVYVPNTNGNSDFDGDGLSDADEYRLRTNPRARDNPAVELQVFGYTAP